MARCPNCGQKTRGDYCQWCNYPILKGHPVRRRKAKRLAKKQAELEAKEKAKREAEEAKKAKEAERLAKKQAELEAKEKAKREAEEAKKAKEAEPVAPPPITVDQLKQIEEYLKQIESICEELRAGKMETKEALKKLSDISDRIAK